MKKNISDLALFGGTPEMQETLHVGRPNIGNRARLMDRINQLLDRRWLANNGPFVQEFEQKIAEYIGAKHCIAVCNATIGLEIAIRALELKGEVILPSFTFIATAHALQWQEITPVFCDIDPMTHNIDSRCVERLITPRTSGILGVHVWGRPCDVRSLSDIAREHRLKLMFDAAHAFGCSYDGGMVGNLGEVEVFSFHATKFLNSFEGGAIITNNDALAKKIRFMINFGFEGYDQVVYLGTNGKMTEVCAAMGLESLESLEEFIQVNFANYAQYKLNLDGVPGITLIAYDENEKNNYQYIVLEVDNLAAGIDRDMLQNILHAENVRARRYFYPGCHKMEPYRSYYPNAGLLLPETEKMTLKVLQLPTGTAVSEEDINKISHIIQFVIRYNEEITARYKIVRER